MLKRGGASVHWAAAGRLAVAVAVIGGAAALPIVAAGGARADQVRQKELRVLNAISVPAAWRVTQGHGVLVAVIDSGVDPTVSDLIGSVVTGLDLTGVGTPESNPAWGMHGTWMASLIAGHGHGRGGTSGVVGVAPKARILSIRVITDRTDPGYAAYRQQPSAQGQRELARAIRYAVRRGAGVISMSLGYVAPSLTVRAALQYAASHNVVVVASSGNLGTAQTAVGGSPAPYSYPADYPGVLGVAAVNAAGSPASFSSDNLSVQVAAPGVNVPAQGRGSRYWLVSGTSPACALTAGVAALIRAKYPKLAAAQVRRAITSSTVGRPHGGYDDQVGFGTLDAARALADARRLARQGTIAPSLQASQTGYFGSGALPKVPVQSRGKAMLIRLAALAVFCLLVFIGSTWRLATGLAGRSGRNAAGQMRTAETPTAAGGPATGFAGAFADGPRPALAPGQPHPAVPELPGQSAAPTLAQPAPTLDQPAPHLGQSAPPDPGFATRTGLGQAQMSPSGLIGQPSPGYLWPPDSSGAAQPDTGFGPAAAPERHERPLDRKPAGPVAPQPPDWLVRPRDDQTQLPPPALPPPALPPPALPPPALPRRSGGSLAFAPNGRPRQADPRSGQSDRPMQPEAARREDGDVGAQQSIVDPVLSWLDRAYPGTSAADQPLAEPRTLPKRHRPERHPPEPGQLGRPSAFWATAASGVPGAPLSGLPAANVAGPSEPPVGDVAQPRSAGSGVAGWQPEPATDAASALPAGPSPRPPQAGQPAPTEPAWDAWSPSATSAPWSPSATSAPRSPSAGTQQPGGRDQHDDRT